MKELFVSNLSKSVGSFAITSIGAAKKSGFQFYYASNWSQCNLKQIRKDEKLFNIKIENIDFERSPFNRKNIRAYKQLLALLKKERFDLIHCNTPVGGFLGRICGKKIGVSKVIYQVHGFHFFKGAPLINWMLYYPIERWLAHYTDALITINQEDYQLAKKFNLRNNGEIYYVPGVGINLEEYNKQTVACDGLRDKLGLKETDFVCISMGDLIPRKNPRISVEAIGKVKNCSNLQYLICGKGREIEGLKEIAKIYGIEDRVHFLGFRTDIKELLRISDCFLFSSLQEGLPRSTMEAMASGLPCVVSKIRGNTDLIEDKVNGFLCDPQNSEEFAEAISQLIVNKELRDSMGKVNLEKIKKFSNVKVEATMKKVYKEVLEKGVQ